MKTIKFSITFVIMIFVTVGMSQPYGLKERIPNTSFIISTVGDTLAEMALERVYTLYLLIVLFILPTPPMELTVYLL